MKFSSREIAQLGFIGSLAFHFGVWMGLYIHKAVPIRFSPKDQIEITVVEPLRAKSKVKPPRLTPPPPIKAQTQVVQQDKIPAKNNTPNPNAKYLGAKNQTVAKETRAKNAGQFKNTIAEKKEILTNEKSDVSQEHASSQTDDYLKDVSNGMQTMLNTQEFAYYNYYQKIKDKVKMHWEPLVGDKVRLKMNQGSRNVASTDEHVTRILIIIDKAGDLAKIDIVGGSGLKDADAAAIEAFKKASPFGAPPKGLANASGEVRMRWDLVLESLDSN
jgi:TonB family protein